MVVIFVVDVVVTKDTATSGDADADADAVFLIETEIDQGVDFSSKHSDFLLGHGTMIDNIAMIDDDDDD